MSGGNDVFARARSTDPETSHEAGRRAGEFAGKHHQLILASLLWDGDADIHEIAYRTGLDHVAVARRMVELQRSGLAEPSGKLAITPTGRKARMWRAVPAERERIAQRVEVVTQRTANQEGT